MTDPYQLLGVSKNASESEIKSAYRKLAKKLHPDLNPGNKNIEQKFKEVTAAYDLLSDPTKRARYDRGEIDNQGQEKGFRYRSDPFSGAGKRRAHTTSFGPDFGVEDLFAQFFGGGRGQGNTSFHNDREEPTQDTSYKITISFAEACLGATKRVTLNHDKTIDVAIPAGIEEGHKLRLKGLSQNGRGAAIIEVHIADHPYFKRDGKNILLTVPLSLPEALYGGEIKIPTLDGSVSLKIPKGANTGTIMRLKGKGVPVAKEAAGDMFVTLQIALPHDTDTLAVALEKWAKKNPYTPRKW